MKKLSESNKSKKKCKLVVLNELQKGDNYFVFQMNIGRLEL